eukprot:CAMPEP_0113469056 /NCGR_PEP_ID=MMETSP0014_2-20120614/15693_1 /TAXON_ID=2857 /ORGANISM="Nitzschia sp." /LENGTH=420 /DNA_ID=CAMNT_0000361503 /DNA_START=379 /DNA_END=1641 /DNA_ORIENTATION=+ /assembly_acc=CAM_ASM_000159
MTSSKSSSKYSGRSRNSCHCPYHPILVGGLVGCFLSACMYFSAYQLLLLKTYDGRDDAAAHQDRQDQDRHEEQDQDHHPCNILRVLLHDVLVMVLTFGMYCNEVVYIAVCCVLASMLVCPDRTTRMVMMLKDKTLRLLSRLFSCCCFCRRRTNGSRFNVLPKKGSSHSISANNEGYYRSSSTTTTRPRHLFEYLVLFECGLLLGSSMMALFVETFTMNLIAAAVTTMQQNNVAAAAAAENEVDASDDASTTTSNTAEIAETASETTIISAFGEGSSLLNNDSIVLLLPPKSLFRFVITNTINTVSCYAVLYIVKKHHYNGCPGGRRMMVASCDRVELVVENGNGEDGADGDGNGGEWWIGDTTGSGGSGDTESTNSNSSNSSDSNSFHDEDYQLDEDADEVDTSLQWLLRPTTTADESSV